MHTFYYLSNKMPAKGFKVVSVREDAYTLASRIADEEHRSIGDVVSQAVTDFNDTRREYLSKARLLLRLAETENQRNTKQGNQP